jgi:beta-glucosidase
MKNHWVAQYLMVVLSIILISSCEQEEVLPYRDTDLSFEERTEDLVSRMTLEEKVSQMVNGSPAIERLGIPEYNWWSEALHGVARAGLATVFPQAIGLGATWDEEHMYNVASVISDEARAKHHNFVSRNKRALYQGLTLWSPNINIFRDPRWGRGQETYGEDPYLTGKMAVQFVKGLQAKATPCAWFPALAQTTPFLSFSFGRVLILLNAPLIL